MAPIPEAIFLDTVDSQCVHSKSDFRLCEYQEIWCWEPDLLRPCQFLESPGNGQVFSIFAKIQLSHEFSFEFV